MVRAILLQVIHHPHAYSPDMAMRQVAMHMLCHPHRFYKYLEQELLETGESYESYCYNIFHCNVWGDDLMAAAFGDMWNLAIFNYFPHLQEADTSVPYQSSAGCISFSKRWKLDVS